MAGQSRWADAASGFDDSGAVGFKRQSRPKLTNENDSSQLFIQSTFSVHMNFFFLRLSPFLIDNINTIMSEEYSITRFIEELQSRSGIYNCAHADYHTKRQERLAELKSDKCPFLNAKK